MAAFCSCLEVCVHVVGPPSISRWTLRIGIVTVRQSIVVLVVSFKSELVRAWR
jgi:hypothetical protein